MFCLLRYCFQVPSKMMYLQRLPQPGWSKAVCSAVPFDNILGVLPKSQLFRHSSASITKAQSFHSSCCNLKKKKPPEPEPRQLDLLRYDMPSLKDSSKPALYLGFAGLIPFVSIPLLMAIQEVSYPELVFAQIAYGACVVSFLGGIRWGFALPEGSPAKPDWINLANSVVPSLFAWLALLFKDDPIQAGMTVIIGLGIALHYDLALLPTYPRWFKALRAILTIVAACSLIATLCIVNAYPEKRLSRYASESEVSK
ncbi:transmembrane protein 69 [Rhineura floridana]|uniref:transmembrane protein 69 n=1 Tax=Rhineura floridana TaxID=261503 RepID=UPI002AC87B68|nr:transmembrane protein 69 [Rhineura floridana]XP_061488824.1 transmembrane protein 69 [Rhineura floridana]XP_061488825.1 transmembrane protein 69 [Rhineura floridana]XP_061488826.1 transmembrane protein 69 [Rhineura floridana]XP_061488827.1 transmembrane protein 69 [Rhineura floridana]